MECPGSFVGQDTVGGSLGFVEGSRVYVSPPTGQVGILLMYSGTSCSILVGYVSFIPLYVLMAPSIVLKLAWQVLCFASEFDVIFGITKNPTNPRTNSEPTTIRTIPQAGNFFFLDTPA